MKHIPTQAPTSRGEYLRGILQADMGDRSDRRLRRYGDSERTPRLQGGDLRLTGGSNKDMHTTENV